jgi:hypothetical protein
MDKLHANMECKHLKLFTLTCKKGHEDCRTCPEPKDKPPSPTHPTYSTDYYLDTYTLAALGDGGPDSGSDRSYSSSQHRRDRRSIWMLYE